MVPQLKRCAFEVSRRLGLTGRIAQSVWRRHCLLVLCYHGVSLADEHKWDSHLYISPSTLARRLESLRRMRCAVLSFEEGVRRMYARTLPERAVALTFDDGYYDFKARALPLLEWSGYPATVYVTTHHCDRAPAVAHLLRSYLQWKQHCAHDVTHADVARARFLSVMTAEELAEISTRGVQVEMHTHRHRTPADPDVFMDDVRVNRARIEAITGRRPRHLCYPSGVYRESYFARLEIDGIETATTCDPALASPSSHPLMLPRFVDCEACPQVAFEAWVSGVATWLPRRTRRANGIH